MVEADFIFKLYLEHPIVTTDSRNCCEGSIFFALKGASFNGNEFAQKAIEAGCEYAVVDEPKHADGKRIFCVKDCLKTLQEIATLNRIRCSNTKFIGITGTNGKTTTKEMISTVLQSKFKTVYTKGNLNNHIGVPLTLLRVTPDTEMAVVEMGANHPGEIADLVKMVKPEYGVITNIGKGHIEGFGSFEGVIQTKKALYDAIDSTKGLAFVNADDKLLTELASSYSNTRHLTYGTGNGVFMQGKTASTSEFLSIDLNCDGVTKHLKTNLVGDYNFPNVMVALAIGKHMGIDYDTMISAISKYIPQNNRSQAVKTGKNLLIVDAYNANPSSMNASISNFINMKKDCKAVILGDMKELGVLSKEEHANIVERLSNANFEKVFLVGPNFCEVADGFQCFDDAKSLASYLQQNPLTGFTILIKGSNCMKLSSLVEIL